MRLPAPAAITLAALTLIPLPAHSQPTEPKKESNPILLQHPIDKRLDEAITLTVTLAPGQTSAQHRHDAQVFVYMLEGEMTTQVQSGPPKHLKPGDTFYESPEDIHTLTTNTGTTPAKFVVFMLKKRGAPILTPVAK